MTIGEEAVRRCHKSARTGPFVAGITAILALIVLVGCAQMRPSPAEAKRSAVELLHNTEEQVAVDWPETPDPSVERCHGGVRFGYFVAVKARIDTTTVAQDLQRLWRSEGMDVSPSRTDFGADAGVLYSATADDGKSAGAGAAYQLSNATVLIRVTSACVDGAIEDYEE